MELRFGCENSYLEFLEHDLSKPINFHKSVDYIIHAAGNAHPSAFQNDPIGTIIGNVNGTYDLLEYAKTHSAQRLLFISTGEVYGKYTDGVMEFDETYSGSIDSTSVRSSYPNSKRTAETLCAAYAKSGELSTVIVRPCHTYGPSLTTEDSRAHAQFIRAVLDNQDILMTSEGNQIRSYCYIADCASIIITVLINGENGEAYNSANPESIASIADFARTVARLKDRQVIFCSPTQKDISMRSPITRQVLSSRKIESLGWRGQYSLEKGIFNTLMILSEAREE